jgi:Lrp/AsnC family leucine-responsive transcriptional regulator
MPIDLDSIDSKLLMLLQANGRKSWADLARPLKLTPPAVAARALRLEKRGIITGYAARVDAAGLGLAHTAFIEVTLEHPRARAPFLKDVRKRDAILECHHMAGDFDYLLKVRVPGTRELEALITTVLKSIPGVARTRTSIVLGSAKETTRLNPNPQ